VEKYLQVIIVGIIAGFVDRAIMLRSDYRRYPTYPHGYITHLSLGFIAAALGAIAIPAISKPDYVAVTFLVLAAQQFREIRNMERESLNKLEETKLIRRGQEYIEGIARVFEARNYLTIITALLCSITVQIWSWPYALITFSVCILFSLKLMGGKQIQDIAQVVPGKVNFKKSLLMVDDVVIMNVGLPASKEKIVREGLGVIIKPKNDNERLTLDAPGQRMAIIHDVISILGSKVDINEMDLVPSMRKQVDKGYYAFFIVPNEPDLDYLIEVIKRVPVLESAKGNTLYTYYGRKAAD
jgi:uncharacterized membrane protein YeaQ/YmgE (transglycosylase-associated protein family)